MKNKQQLLGKNIHSKGSRSHRGRAHFKDHTHNTYTNNTILKSMQRSHFHYFQFHRKIHGPTVNLRSSRMVWAELGWPAANSTCALSPELLSPLYDSWGLFPFRRWHQLLFFGSTLYILMQITAIYPSLFCTLQQYLTSKTSKMKMTACYRADFLRGSF